MRAFIAIPLEDSANDAVEAWLQKNQAAKMLGARMVSRGNRHITVKFLGEIEQPLAAEIAAALEGLAEKSRRGILPGAPLAALRGAGFFPNAQRPRVFWLGIGAGREWFQAVFAELETALGGLGLPREERPYFPHITLSRLRGECAPAGEAVRQIQNEIVAEFVPQRIVLYSSRLGGREARYDELAGFPFTDR